MSLMRIEWLKRAEDVSLSVAVECAASGARQRPELRRDRRCRRRN